METQIKIGFIVDEWGCSKYDLELMRWVQAQAGMNAMLLLQRYPAARGGRWQRLCGRIRQRGLLAYMAQLGFGWLSRLDNFFLRRLQPQHADHLGLHDARQVVGDVLELHPHISSSGYVHRFSDDEVKRIREQRLDVLLRCGSGILKGDILQVAHHGIWSFHHADNRINRGGPPAFWEVFLRQASTGFVIQRLSEELDGGDILFRGAYPTQWFYLFNQAELFCRATYHMQQLLRRLQASGVVAPSESIDVYAGPLYRTPTLWQQFLYLSYFLRRYLRFAIEFRRGMDVAWSVAFAHRDWKDTVMWRAQEIPNPPGRFLADPFVAHQDGRSVCFVEDYHYAAHRGEISAWEIKDGQATELGVALREPFHLSYPYLLRHEDQLYMCPEAYQSHEIRLYQCDEFPLKWSFKKVLMKDVAAADTTLFAHDGKWWMLTNIDPLAQEQHCAELYLFYADDLLEGDWQPHPNNPVVFDPDHGRNGGFLRDGNDIYRVAQKQGFNCYGQGFSIRRVTALSETDYAEDCVFEAGPDFKPGLSGTHHMHSENGLTVFDLLRYKRVR